MPEGVLILGWLVSGAAGMIQGLTGFGFGISFGAAMLLVAPPGVVITATVALGIPIGLGVALQARRAWKRRLVPALVGAGLLGVPAGTLVIARLPAGDLRAAVSALALVGALGWLLVRPAAAPGRARPWLAGAAALLAGAVNGATGMGGPILAVVAATQRWDKTLARGVLASFNFGTLALTLVAGAALHARTFSHLTAAAIWMPTALTGAWIGARLAGRIAPRRFPTLLVAIAGLCAAIALVSLLASVAGRAG